MADIAALADIAHGSGALLAVDNCFCPPALQQPLKLGADLSAQSATKAIDGQGRVLGGVVCGRADLVEKMAMYVNSAGLSPSPFNARILPDGCETLPLRMERQSTQALAATQWLQGRPEVAKVYTAYYPNIRRPSLPSNSRLPAAWQLIVDLIAGLQGALERH